MNFASVTFLFFFLPVIVALYFVLRSRGARNVFLLIASLFFYAWGEGAGLSLLLISIMMNHEFSLRIAKRPQPWLAIGITANLALLVAFKYLGLITETVGLPRIEPRLPLGISFYTFQAMSLLIDVSRGSKPATNAIRTGLYISMFPQLIAGPIVRWDEIRAQIVERRESWDRFCDGTKLFMLGLAQKVLIADVIAQVADSAFGADATTLGPTAAWIGLAAFTLQIYFDFAGYSNMAIGLGRIFGFELPRNFEHPYSAASFQEFWRRWHMTLSRWFRDYLYIPLGGSRDGAARTYRNLLIVFVLCGLWHGAAWTFLLWGLWHGVFLIGERLARSRGFPKMPRLIGVIYTVLFVSLGWVLFRADSLPHALAYWAALIPGGEGGDMIGVPQSAAFAMIVGALLAWDGWKGLGARIRTPELVGTTLSWTLIAGLTILCFAAVASTTHQPFLYFRF
ncbi:MBOAT family O-acyltransferase [Algimonas porphyrae]|uniref:Probable alginate O-acetylase AlgI n=1 Tax=Algimonas porphyrae TaxID=1128113 RepID=A0ABQ5UWV0_9PROT|nr:MBOAT family protein [Algimonas porphyrae]GLQ19187.1 alginate regulatory protein [Algimonas porphyrae]